MKDKKLQKYLIRTFLITWIIWLSLALLVEYKLLTFSSVGGTILFIIGGFGPAIAAISVIDGKITLKSIIEFIFKRKKQSIMYLLVFCLMEAAVFVFSSLELNSDVSAYMIPLLFLQMLFIAGGQEELGWRGVMQPELEKKIPFPLATIITGLTWSIWHLPLWLINGSAQQGSSFLVFVIYVVFLSFFLACIYKKTKCIFDCAIFHALSNFLMAILILKVNAIYLGGLSIMLIISIILWYKDKESIKSN